jgi:hypothetical protein
MPADAIAAESPGANSRRRWLGLLLGGQHYALAMDCVTAVFRQPPGQPWLLEERHLEVVAHEGAPVFLLDASEVINDAASEHQGEWVVALRSSQPSSVGLRVASVAGPFPAIEHQGKVTHHDQVWLAVPQPAFMEA